MKPKDQIASLIEDYAAAKVTGREALIAGSAAVLRAFLEDHELTPKAKPHGEVSDKPKAKKP